MTYPRQFTPEVHFTPDGKTVTVRWTATSLVQLEMSYDLVDWQKVNVPMLRRSITLQRSEAQQFFRCTELDPAKILWVAAHGSDASARKGDKARPWATINAAALKFLPGEVMLIDSGDFEIVGKSVIVPVEAKVIGSGVGYTNINNQVLMTKGGPAFTLQDRCLVALVGVACKEPDYQSGIGIHPATNSLPFRDARTYKVSVVGRSDALYVRHTQPCSLTDVGSQFVSEWDGGAFFSGAHEGRFEGTQFRVSGQCSFATEQCNNALRASDRAKVVLRNCTLSAKDNPTSSRALFLTGTGYPSVVATKTVFEASTPGWHALRPEGTEDWLGGNGTMVCHSCTIDSSRVNFPAVYD